MKGMKTLSAAALAAILFSGCAGEAPVVKPAAALKAETIGDLKAGAKAAWEKRSTREGTQEAIDRWETAAQKDPKDMEVRADLAHAYYWMGEVFETDTDKKIGYFEKGAEHGYAGLEVDENYIPAVYWTAVCVGSRGVLSSFVQKLRFARKAKALQEKVLETDETFFHGGTHLFWGRFNVVADGLAGGTFEESYSHFERAIQIQPNYLRAYLMYAENTLLAITRKSPEKIEADREKAKQLLKKVIDTPASVLPEAEPENVVAKRQAEALYAKEFGAGA
ncbi:MAG: TRAP transporter TatT component family protein [Candidatus Methylomirabilis sp.]|nr:TRAP transporter TatT component family protein [Deltaproteobacteria bacterium]